MKFISAALVYTALTLGAITGGTMASADVANFAALRDGDMKKLVIHETPEATSSAAFQLADGAGEQTLEAYRGKYVLLNFWATWCAPCRKEMPTIQAIVDQFADSDLHIVLVNTAEDEDTVFNFLGIVAPDMSISGDHFEAVGDFGAL